MKRYAKTAVLSATVFSLSAKKKLRERLSAPPPRPGAGFPPPPRGGGGGGKHPLHFSSYGLKTKGDIAINLCIPLSSSISHTHTLTKGIFQGSDRSAVNYVKLTSRSPDFGQK